MNGAQTEPASSESRSPSIQTPRDVGVVMPTICRSTIVRAVESVFRQDISGKIHLVIGVDAVERDRSALRQLLQSCPDHVTITVLDPGYSTSRRHGGLHPASDGGVLRTILSYLVNAPLVAYLDDDNWWAPDHLSSLMSAIQGRGWAFSYRWFADPGTGEPLCEDRWESVGPDRGVLAQKAGGFVDPNTLMIDKTVCEPVLRLWSRPLIEESGHAADRNVFSALRAGYAWAATGRATSFYTIRPGDSMDPYWQKWIADWKAHREAGTT